MTFLETSSGSAQSGVQTGIPSGVGLLSKWRCLGQCSFGLPGRFCIRENPLASYLFLFRDTDVETISCRLPFHRDLAVAPLLLLLFFRGTPPNTPPGGDQINVTSSIIKQEQLAPLINNTNICCPTHSKLNNYAMHESRWRRIPFGTVPSFTFFCWP